MEFTRLLYDQYRYEKATTKEEPQFDMIKRIEDYRKNCDLYNSIRSIPSDRSISSTSEIKAKKWLFAPSC